MAEMTADTRRSSADDAAIGATEFDAAVGRPAPLPGSDARPHRRAGIDHIESAEVAPLRACSYGDCVHHRFEAQAIRTPDAVAVRQGNTALTYAELDTKANRLAHALRGLGVGPEGVVGICLPAGPDLLCAMLAVLKAGGAYLPLDTATSNPLRIVELADAACCRLLLATSAFDARLSPQRSLPTFNLDAHDAVTRDLPSGAPDCVVRPANLAYVLYTSGSSGRPKAVMVEHRALDHYLRWCARNYVAEDAHGSPVLSSLAFDLALTGVYPSLLAGQQVVFPSDWWDFDELREVLLRHRDFSVLKVTPTHMNLIVQILAGRLDGLARHVVVGGEQISGASLAEWRRELPNAMFHNEYGPTEATVGMTVYRVPVDAPVTERVPIGRAIDGTEAIVLDRYMRPVPTGTPGELYIGGISLARGYLGQPAMTAQRFVPHPWRVGGRLYRSGDRVRRLDDGDLDFLGRYDSQVKVRGFRIDVEEVEAAVRAHPAVAECAVSAAADEGALVTLVAHIVCASGLAVTPRELRAFVAGSLPSYMVPSKFLLIDKLPLRPNGKLDRDRLSALPVSRATPQRRGSTAVDDAGREGG